jgi:hypothetical protein
VPSGAIFVLTNFVLAWGKSPGLAAARESTNAGGDRGRTRRRVREQTPEDKVRNGSGEEGGGVGAQHGGGGTQQSRRY